VLLWSFLAPVCIFRCLERLGFLNYSSQTQIDGRRFLIVVGSRVWFQTACWSRHGRFPAIEPGMVDTGMADTGIYTDAVRHPGAQ
jgi:hypothetical protein